MKQNAYIIALYTHKKKAPIFYKNFVDNFDIENYYRAGFFNQDDYEEYLDGSLSKSEMVQLYLQRWANNYYNDYAEYMKAMTEDYWDEYASPLPDFDIYTLWDRYDQAYLDFMSSEITYQQYLNALNLYLVIVNGIFSDIYYPDDPEPEQ